GREQAGVAMIEAARPGVSEAEVYAEILYEVHRWGCDTRYPFLSLQSGPDNIAWGVPRWTLRAEPPRILAQGDLVQAEIHTMYGAQESQVQMSIALDPADHDIAHAERAARLSYEAGLKANLPRRPTADVVAAMYERLRVA